MLSVREVQIVKLLLHYINIKEKINRQLQELKILSTFKNNNVERISQIHSYNLNYSKSLAHSAQQSINSIHENRCKYKKDIIFVLEMMNKVEDHNTNIIINDKIFFTWDNYVFLENFADYSDIKPILHTIYANLYYIWIIEATMSNNFESIISVTKEIIENNISNIGVIS